MNDINQEIEQAKELLAQTDDPQIRALAKEELDRLMLSKEAREEENRRNAVLEIRPGTGGGEAELFAMDLFRMYQRYATSQGWKIEILEMIESEISGLKSLTCLIKGPDAYLKLRFEGGVHRVQRVPKTEKSGRIHTSAASVVVLPQAKDIDVKINPTDLRIDVYRSSGHGGQSVNTTDSAVRITHLPTGIVVACQDERSQLKNKEKALSILRSKLWDVERTKQEEITGESRRSMIKSGDRSDKIRTYNFPQSRITDHRLGKSWQNLEKVLGGGLDPIIDELRKISLSTDESA